MAFELGHLVSIAKTINSRLFMTVPQGDGVVGFKIINFALQLENYRTELYVGNTLGYFFI